MTDEKCYEMKIEEELNNDEIEKIEIQNKDEEQPIIVENVNDDIEKGIINNENN